MRRAPATLAVVGLVLAVLAAGPVMAQSPAPVDAAAVVDAALAGVRAHDSWRFEDRSVNTLWSGLDTVTAGTVLRSPEWRTATDITVDGETGWRRVVIGRKGWQNLYDGTFHPMKFLGIPVPKPGDPLPYEPALRQAVAAGITLSQLADEERDGVTAHHYQGSTPDLVTAATASPSPVAASPVASQAPSPSPSPAAALPTYSATVELWVDAESGALLASTVDSAQTIPIPGTAAPAAFTVHEAVTITGVDDPANAVTAPSLATVGLDPAAGGDPSLEPMVLGAFSALRDLDSYQATVDFLGNGYTGVTQLVVDNGKPTAVEQWSTFRGQRTAGVLVIGRKHWSAKEGAPPWTPARTSLDTVCAAPCTVASLTDLGSDVASSAATYTLVSDQEDVDGVPAIHLRSTAGREIAGFGIFPGTADLWIAKDGGHLLRDVFDGTAQRRITTITAVDDPANEIAAPR